MSCSNRFNSESPVIEGNVSFGVVLGSLPTMNVEDLSLYGGPVGSGAFVEGDSCTCSGDATGEASRGTRET